MPSVAREYMRREMSQAEPAPGLALDLASTLIELDQAQAAIELLDQQLAAAAAEEKSREFQVTGLVYRGVAHDGRAKRAGGARLPGGAEAGPGACAGAAQSDFDVCPTGALAAGGGDVAAGAGGAPGRRTFAEAQGAFAAAALGRAADALGTGKMVFVKKGSSAMRMSDLLRRLSDQPFRPFLIHLTDGTELPIEQPQMVIVGLSSAVLPTRFGKDENGHQYAEDWRTVSILHMAQFSDLDKPKNGRRHKRR